MAGPTRHIHPQHRDQQNRRIASSVVLYLIAFVILAITILMLLGK